MTIKTFQTLTGKAYWEDDILPLEPHRNLKGN